MPKRRKGQEESDYSLAEKKKKTDSCLDERLAPLTKFLSLFQSDIVAALTYFLSVARSSHEGTDKARSFDFLRAYVERHSADCEHILSPLSLDRDKRNQDVLLLCFQCLEQVLLFTASSPTTADSASTESDQSLTKLCTSVGLRLVADILSTHMRCIYSSLQSSQPMRLVASAVKLLTSMVLQGPSAARDLQQSFNFGYKPLEVLPSRTHILEGMTESVRHCWMNFALAFLVVADSDVVSSILELKGFLSSFFKLLPKDSPGICQLYINALLQKVILNTGISKRVKSSFFNQFVLKQTAQLLRDLESPGTSREDGGTSCEGLVMEFLLTLCTNFKCGICYQSKPGPERLERTNNPVILHFLLSLTGSLQSRCVQQLITTTLSACPDIVIPYFRALTLNFDPQPTSQWVHVSEVMIEILSSLPSVIDMLGLDEVTASVQAPPPSSHLRAAVGVTVPSFLSRNTLSIGLQHSVPLVKHQTMRLIETILERSTCVVNSYGAAKVSLASVDSFPVRYRDCVMRSVPDVRTVISLTQQLLSSDKVKVVDVEKFSLDDNIKNSDVSSGNHLLCLALNLLRLYQVLSPELFVQVDFNLAKLLPTSGVGDKARLSDSDVLKNTLQILLDSPSGCLKWKQLSSGCLTTILELCANGNEEIAHLAHRVAVKTLTGTHALKEYECELEVLLLSMKSCLAAGAITEDTASTLIHYVATLLLSSVQNYHVNNTRVEKILCNSPLPKDECGVSLSMGDILAAPLEIPGVSSTPKSDSGDSRSPEQICPLVLCLLSSLEHTDKLPSDPVVSFIADLLPKLLLVHQSSTLEAIATVALDYLKVFRKEDTIPSKLQCLAESFEDWLIGTTCSTADSRSPSATAKKSRFKKKKSLYNKDPLNFLSTLIKVLHSKPGSHPMDALAGGLSDQQLRDALETSFDSVLSPGNPALLCCLRAVKVLLNRLSVRWKNTSLGDDQNNTLSFLFRLLQRAITRLSELRASRSEESSRNEDDLCNLLELVVDRRFVQNLFLYDGWLEQAFISKDETHRIASSVDYICTQSVGDLLRVMIECCSRFSLSPVFKLAVSRLFSAAKLIVGQPQCEKAVGTLLTELLEKLHPMIGDNDLISFTDDVIHIPKAGRNDNYSALVDLLFVVLVPETKINEKLASFNKKIGESGRELKRSVCMKLSNLALNKLLTMTHAYSSEKLDMLTHSVLNYKLTQSGVQLRLLSDTVAQPVSDDDGLVSCAYVVTKALLCSDTASVSPSDKDLAVTCSIIKARTRPQLAESSCDKNRLLKDLRRSIEPNSYASKLLDLSLFSRLCDKPTTSASVYIGEKVAKSLLHKASVALSPAIVEIAALLIERSTTLLECLASQCISSLCQSLSAFECDLSDEDSEELRKFRSCFYLIATFLKALTALDLDELPTVFKRAVKSLKSVVDKCINVAQSMDNLPELNAMVVKVTRGICKFSSKGLKRFRESITVFDREMEADEGPWNQRLISIACCVAIETMDAEVCVVAVRRAVQRWTHLMEDGSTLEEDKVIEDLTVVLHMMHSKDIPLSVKLINQNWRDFLTHMMSISFGSASVLKVVALMVAVLDGSGDWETPAMEELYQLLWSHSEFLTVLSTEIESKTKESLIELLVAIVERRPSVCQPAHVGVILGAYTGTRSITDRGLLYLLFKYEVSGVSTTAYRPYLWGSAALEHYQQKQKQGWLLWKQPSVQEMIELMDKKRLHQSAANFPINVKLEPINPYLHSGVASEVTESLITYDPCFMIPFLSHLLDPGNVVDCRRFVDHGCLGYLIMALSSQHAEVRAASGHALTRFTTHMDGTRFREKAQIALLLEVLKNTIAEPSKRINSVAASFFARSAHLFLDPDNPVYPAVAHFMVYKPALDLSDIPLYNMLLHSSSVKNTAERRWILNVLVDGATCDEDVILYRKRHVLSQLISLYNSDILDTVSKMLISRLVARTACVPGQAKHLLFGGRLGFITL